MNAFVNLNKKTHSAKQFSKIYLIFGNIMLCVGYYFSDCEFWLMMSALFCVMNKSEVMEEFNSLKYSKGLQ